MENDILATDLPVLAAAVAGYLQTRKKRRRTMAQWDAVLEMEAWEEGLDAPEEKLTRRVFPRPDYSTSGWAVMLRNPDLLDHTSRAAERFRRRFRVPHVFFVKIVELVKEKGWFACTAADAVGRQCIPPELKVLASLQILGRGNCFDDVCQLSLMSEATVFASFHKFCKHFAEELYDDHVYLPTGAAQDNVMKQYHTLGFTGAIGSTDVTHVKWDCCPYSLARSYTGKEGYPTVAYQATVDFSGRILAVTEGFAGAQNDKTIIRYDKAVQRIREDPTYRNKTFHLNRKDGTLEEHKGNYLIVDNGYHKWEILIPPIKYPENIQEARWSNALESVRKDVECCFGRLKGRFRLLKLPILYRTKERINNVFFTCCILHNMLHAFDGLDQLEPNTDWEGEDGLHDAWIADPCLDTSSIGARVSKTNETVEVEPTHDTLKEKLITSFTYRKAHDNVCWLSRRK